MTRLLRREKEAAAQVLSLMTVFISLSVAISFSLISAIQDIDTDAQPESISVQDTIITAPLTILVPITADIQNAQICVSIASSGGQSCNQVVVDPVENSYEPVNADLSSETPTLTTAEQEPTATTTAATTSEQTTTTTTTTEPTAPTTTAPTITTTEEPTTTTTQEPVPDSGTQEPSTESSTSEGGSQ
jgi:hypothetical protein